MQTNPIMLKIKQWVIKKIFSFLIHTGLLDLYYAKIVLPWRKFKQGIIGFVIGGAVLSASIIVLTPNIGFTQQADNLINNIEIAQSAYFLEHGRYFQGIKTHSEIPSFNSSTKADWKGKPDDQDETWNDFKLNLSKNLPFQAEIHVYENSKGDHGYQIFLRSNFEGVEHVKSIGYGVQAAERTFDWRVIVEGSI